MRTCGGCMECCLGFLAVEVDGAIIAGYRCPHAMGGCDMYENRPEQCRVFLCEWMRLPSHYPDGMRPDRVRCILMLQRIKDIPHLVAIRTDAEPNPGEAVRLNRKVRVEWNKETNRLNLASTT